jgi:hypothetical protein
MLLWGAELKQHHLAGPQDQHSPHHSPYQHGHIRREEAFQYLEDNHFELVRVGKGRIKGG